MAVRTEGSRRRCHKNFQKKEEAEKIEDEMEFMALRMDLRYGFEFLCDDIDCFVSKIVYCVRLVTTFTVCV